MIVAANRNRVAGLSDLKAAASGAASLVLQLRRGGRTLVMPLRAAWGG